VQRSEDARGEYLIVCPLPNYSIEKYEKYRHNKTTCPGIDHVPKDYAVVLKLFGSWTTFVFQKPFAGHKN